MTGNLSGGGLLIVTGDFSCAGPYTYNGLILVVGSGRLYAEGSGAGLAGSLFLANLTNADGTPRFGVPSLSIRGSSRFRSNRGLVRMALGLIPVTQISFREIAGSDP